MKPVKFSISSNFPTRPITFPHPHQHLTQAQRMWHWTSWQHIMTLWHFLHRCDRACWNQSKKTVKLEMPHQTFFFGRFVFGCPVCPLCLVCLFLLGPSWLVGYVSSLNLVCVFLLGPSLHIVPTTFFGSTNVLAYIFISCYFTTRNCLILDIMAWICLTWWWVEGQCSRCFCLVVASASCVLMAASMARKRRFSMKLHRDLYIRKNSHRKILLSEWEGHRRCGS